MADFQYQPTRGIATQLLILLLILIGLVYASQPEDRVVSIAEARSLPPGTAVTVDGSVTTPSGAFESSFFDKGFGLQDHTGGIYVSLQSDLNMAPRRRVRVSGTLKDSFGLLILAPTDPTAVTFHGAGPSIVPQWFATGLVGEATEGRIVKVTGHITQAPEDDLPYGFKFFVDDGSGEIQIFVNVQTDIDVSGLSIGQMVSVTGFSGQFKTHYEIEPRSPSDIVVPIQ